MNFFQKLIKITVDFLSKALPKAEATQPKPEPLGVNPYKFMLEQLDKAFPQQTITPDSQQPDIMFKAGQRQVIEWIRHQSTKWR